MRNAKASLTARCIVVASATALALGCAHNAASTSETTADSTPAPMQKKPQLVGSQQPQAAPADVQGQQDLEKALEALRNVNIFFGFNDDTLTPQARTKLSDVADVLVKHPTLKLRIDGNADERGTEAYNLVLGQKRADSAKRYLVTSGVSPDQLSTVSYGADRPRAPGHDEKSWQENRRDDVVVTPSGSTDGQ